MRLKARGGGALECGDAKYLVEDILLVHVYEGTTDL